MCEYNDKTRSENGAFTLFFELVLPSIFAEII